MRPRPVVWFERLVLAALAIDLLNNLVAWRLVAAAVSEQGSPINPGLYLVLSMLPVMLGLVLWYLVARRASNVARWITTVLVVLGTLSFATTAIRIGAPIFSPIFFVACFSELLKLAAVACLFPASAAAWFAQEPDPV